MVLGGGVLQLPFVLGGPILRHCDETSITVWVALSIPCTSLELQIYRDTSLPAAAERGSRTHESCVGSSNVDKDGKTRSAVEIERLYFNPVENLHIYLLRAQPFAQKFDSGQLLAYDILFKNINGSESESLFEAGSEEPLFFAQGRSNLPTVLLQGEHNLRLWTASCSKLHGVPNSAYTEMVDGGHSVGQRPVGLASSYNNLEVRPHYLLLLGDQIYADDVPFSLTRKIRELAYALDPSADLITFKGRTLDCRELDANQRHEIVSPNNKFTPFSSEAENHLLCFSEFCAYYLLNINADLWPPSDELDARGSEAIRCLQWSRNREKERVGVETDRLAKNRIGVVKARIVMANVPTLSILDDHEVTDDLFFNAEWMRPLIADALSKESERTEKIISKLGQYITANGLSAYALFQAFGCRALDSAASNLLQSRVNFEAAGNALESLISCNWSFITPTRPPILFLDTRTKRTGYGRDGEKIPIKRIDRILAGAFQWSSKNMHDVYLIPEQSLASLLSSYGISGELVFLVTPSPVLSSDSIDGVKSFANNDPLHNDEEMWRSNLTNFFGLVDELIVAGIKRCVVISGDVHYGYRRSSRIEKFTGRSGTSLSVEQVVSSSALNSFETGYGDGLPWYMHASSLVFKNDYGEENIYSFDPAERCWTVNPNAEQTITREWYREVASAAKAEFSKGGATTGVIAENHFVELEIDSTGIRRCLYHLCDESDVARLRNSVFQRIPSRM